MIDNHSTGKASVCLFLLNDIILLALLALGILVYHQRCEENCQVIARRAVQQREDELLGDMKTRLLPMYEDLGLEYDPGAKDIWGILRPFFRLTRPMPPFEGSVQNDTQE